MICKERLERVFTEMSGNNTDVMLVSDPSSVNYLTGKLIAPGERMMVLILKLKDKSAEFILSRLYPQTEDIGCPVVYFDDTEDPVMLISERIKNTSNIGIDKNWQARFLLRLMQISPDKRYFNGSFIIDNVRQIKSAQEQQWMIEASRINDMAVERLIPETAKGYTEKQLADRLLEIYHELGSEEFSFYPICCYGANAADPHHSNDDTCGKEGDSVILDIGCMWKGYCSDMTRTVFLGKADAEQKKVYEIVKQANLKAIDAVRPGVRFCDVDAAARNYIAAQGYGEYFVHRTGHNIGQDVHEYGDVSSVNKNILKPGMVFSIEPGIYLPGSFGVRIEDLVLVTEDGCRVLNSFKKDLIIV